MQNPKASVAIAQIVPTVFLLLIASLLPKSPPLPEPDVLPDFDVAELFPGTPVGGRGPPVS